MLHIRYGGLLDGYNDGPEGGKVYHVTYDDGDDEALEEEEVDGGDNVRLVDNNEDPKQNTSHSEVGF